MKPDTMTSDLAFLVMYVCITQGEPCPICGAEWEFTHVGERRFVALAHRSHQCGAQKIFAFEDRSNGDYDGPIFAPDLDALATAPRAA